MKQVILMFVVSLLFSTKVFSCDACNCTISQFDLREDSNGQLRVNCTINNLPSCVGPANTSIVSWNKGTTSGQLWFDALLQAYLAGHKIDVYHKGTCTEWDGSVVEASLFGIRP